MAFVFRQDFAVCFVCYVLSIKLDVNSFETYVPHPVMKLKTAYPNAARVESRQESEQFDGWQCVLSWYWDEELVVLAFI